MDEFIKKLIAAFEQFCKPDCDGCCSKCHFTSAVGIVNHLAEEYNDGWIPCEKELPPPPTENPLFDNRLVELYLVSDRLGDYPFRAFWNGKFFTDGFGKVDAAAWQPLPAPYKEKVKNPAEAKKEWILIDYDFRNKLPKEDCQIWITRVMCTGKRWVQKVEFYAEDRDIEWDGTIAWMVAQEDEAEPSPCAEICVMTIQRAR